MSFNLSVTRLRSFISCQRRYHHLYNLQKWESSNFHAESGQVIHQTLAQFHGLPQTEQTREKLIEIHRQEFGNTKYKLLDAHVFEKHRMMLTDYFLTHQKNPTQILDLEKRHEIYLDNGVPIVAVIDRVDKINETTIRIKDYKTGAVFPTQYEVDQDEQLSLYDLLAQTIYPWAENIELELHYLDGMVFKTTRKPHQRTMFKDYIFAMYHKMLHETKFEPRLNDYCHNCSFRADCSLYQKTVNEPSEIGGEGFLAEAQGEGRKMVVRGIELKLPEDLPKLGQFLERLNYKMKIFEKLSDELKAGVLNYLNSQNQSSLDTEQHVFSVSKKEYEFLDIQTVRQVLEAYRPGQFDKVINVTKKKIDEFLKILKEEGKAQDAERLEEAVKVNVKTGFSKPFLAFDKKKVFTTDQKPQEVEATVAPMMTATLPGKILTASAKPAILETVKEVQETLFKIPKRGRPKGSKNSIKQEA